MKIGELAERAGCKVVTVRYYEKKGLMRQPGRTEGNYRLYDQQDLERLCFIRHCRRHGMSLEEIGGLLQLAQGSGANCTRVHEMVRRHIDQLDIQMKDLQDLRNSLAAMLEKCGSNGATCEVLHELRTMEACAYCKNNPGIPAQK